MFRTHQSLKVPQNWSISHKIDPFLRFLFSELTIFQIIPNESTSIVDLSYRNITDLKSAAQIKPRKCYNAARQNKESSKYEAKTVKLSNNLLTGLTGIEVFIQEVNKKQSPDWIDWGRSIYTGGNREFFRCSDPITMYNGNDVGKYGHPHDHNQGSCF